MMWVVAAAAVVVAVAAAAVRVVAIQRPRRGQPRMPELKPSGMHVRRSLRKQQCSKPKQ